TSSRRDAPASPEAEPGLALTDASQSPTAGGRAESLIGGPWHGEGQDIAAGPMAGPAVVRFGDFAWALAHAGVGDEGCRIDGGGRLSRDDGRCRLARGRGGLGGGGSGALAGPGATASGLGAGRLAGPARGAK